MSAAMNTTSSNMDAEHAHNMPKLVTRVEGRGNGLKTCIVNVNQVACVLKRPPQYAAKFLGLELGTSADYQCSSRDKDEGDRLTINGLHDSDVIQSALDQFIEAYVMCRDCDSLDTTLKVGRGKVSGKCMACGWSGSFVGKQKVTEYMVMNPPDASGLAIEGWASEDESKLSKEEKRHFRFLEEAKYDSDGESTWYPDSDDELSLCVMSKKKARMKTSRKGSHDDSSSSSSSSGWGLDTDEEEIDDKDMSLVGDRKKEKKEKKDKKEKKEKKEKNEKSEKNEHEMDVEMQDAETGDDLDCAPEKLKKRDKKSKKSSKGALDKNDERDAKENHDKKDPELEAEMEAYLESVTEMFKGCRKKKVNKDKKVKNDKQNMEDTEQDLEEEVAECMIEKIKEYDKGDGKPSDGRKKSEKKCSRKQEKTKEDNFSEHAEDNMGIHEVEKTDSNEKADGKGRKDLESKKEEKDKKETRDKSSGNDEKHGGEDLGFKEKTTGPKVQSKEEDKANETHQNDWDASAEGGKKGSHGQPEFAAGVLAALQNPLKTAALRNPLKTEEKEASEDEGIWDDEAWDDF